MIDRERLDKALLQIRLIMLEFLLARVARHQQPSAPGASDLPGHLDGISQTLQGAMLKEPPFQELSDAERALLQDEIRELALAMQERLRLFQAVRIAE